MSNALTDCASPRTEPAAVRWLFRLLEQLLVFPVSDIEIVFGVNHGVVRSIRSDGVMEYWSVGVLEYRKG